jgi:hypothetical protein
MNWIIVVPLPPGEENCLFTVASSKGWDHPDFLGDKAAGTRN